MGPSAGIRGKEEQIKLPSKTQCRFFLSSRASAPPAKGFFGNVRRKGTGGLCLRQLFTVNNRDFGLAVRLPFLETALQLTITRTEIFARARIPGLLRLRRSRACEKRHRLITSCPVPMSAHVCLGKFGEFWDDLWREP